MDTGWNAQESALLVLFLCALVAFLLYFAVKALARRVFTRPTYCLACGATTIPKPHYRGSFIAEAGLWDLLVVPGIVYSIWRLHSRRMGCAACGSEQLVSPDSPGAVADAQRRAKESA